MFPSDRPEAITRRVRVALRKAHEAGASDPVKDAARRLKIAATLRARYAADEALREAKAAHLATVRPPLDVLNGARKARRE